MEEDGPEQSEDSPLLLCTLPSQVPSVGVAASAPFHCGERPRLRDDRHADLLFGRRPPFLRTICPPSFRPPMQSGR